MKMHRIAAWVVREDGSGYLSDLLLRSEQEIRHVMDGIPGFGKVIPIPVKLEVPDDGDNDIHEVRDGE